MEDLIAWLRATIQGDKAVAEKAASGERDGVTFTGCWAYTDEYRAVFQEGRASGADAIVSGSCGCCFPDATGHAEDLAHIAIHDPRDTIARCEAELALLDEMIPIIEELDYIAMSEGLGSVPFGEPVARLLRLMARGYQNRPGFKPSWLDG